MGLFLSGLDPVVFGPYGGTTPPRGSEAHEAELAEIDAMIAGGDGREVA